MGEQQGREVVFRNDPHNEAAIIAAVLAGGARSDAFLAEAVRQPPDAFLTPEHAAIWRAVRDAHSRKLAPDPATLARLSNNGVDVSYLAEIMAGRPEVPDDATLKFYLEQLAYDRQLHLVVTGPVDSLLQEIQKAKDPEKIKSFGRQIAAALDGWGDTRHFLDAGQLVRDQVADMRERMAGRAIYPYGIEGLDLFDGQDELPKNKRRRRMIPGAKPGNVTVITGVPGSGKSTTTARIVLGLARMKRKVLYGAWEMTGGMTLELMATMSLGWSRSMMTEGRFRNEQIREIETRMHQISKYVQFMANPFRRTIGGKPSNERNLDLIHGYVAGSGCSVFVADLWKRCLVRAQPEDEEEALYRQQAMVEELGVHAILIQQQRLKDVETRPDKRPTREGIKGSGAWTEIADTILGTHRPALWKDVDDEVLEVDVLKQRYGKWPLAVEFDWDADLGSIKGGRSISYEVSSGPGNDPIDLGVKTSGKKGKR